MNDPHEELPPEISVEELKRWLDDEREVTLIDVREPHEHQICRLDGARLIPIRELPHRLDELPDQRDIVVHCHHGPRSAHAVAYLRQQGLPRVTNLAGGIDAWSLRVDPSVPRY